MGGKLTKDRIPVTENEEEKGPKPKPPKPAEPLKTEPLKTAVDSEASSTSASSSCYGETDSGVDLEELDDKSNGDGEDDFGEGEGSGTRNGMESTKDGYNNKDITG